MVAGLAAYKAEGNSLLTAGMTVTTLADRVMSKMCTQCAALEVCVYF